MPGRRVRRSVVLLGGVVIAALLAGAIVWLLRRDSDDSTSTGTTSAPPTSSPPPPSGMVVALERLGIGDSAAPAGANLEFVVSAAAQAPLTAIELWAGESLAERRELTEHPTAARATFGWSTPDADAVITARAVDIDGRTEISNAIRVSVGGPQSVSTIVDYTVVAGDTIESIADAHHTSAQLVALANPGVFQPEGVAAGTVVHVPVEVAFPGTAEPSGGPTRATPLAGPPAADVALDGCRASVAAVPGARADSGVAAYLLPPDGEMFELVDTADATSSLDFDVPPGGSLLVVGAYADGIETLGPPQLVQPTEPCGGWDGDVRLDGSRLVGGAEADAAYLYLSDGGPWQRVPATGFVDPSEGGFDFAGLLPDMASGRLDLEAWGRKGGALVFLGDGHYRATAPVLPSAQHVRTQLWWIKTPAANGQPETLAKEGFIPTPHEVPFRWKVSSAAVTKAAWQVTSYPVPASAGLDVPGVIAQDFVPANQPTFTIDFSKFTGPPVATASAGAALGPMAAAGGPLIGGTGGSANAGGGGSNVAVTPPVIVGAGGPQLGDGVVVDAGAIETKVPEPTRFYVRMVPFVGEQFAGTASSPVVIDTKFDASVIGVIDTTPGPNVYDLDVKVSAPVAPIPWFSKCWRITEIDPSKFDAKYALINQGWQVFVGSIGDVVCPICYKTGSWKFDYAGYYGWHCKGGGFKLGDPGTWDEFPILGPLVSGLIEVGVTAWDFVVELATYLKAKVVDLVAKVGCESFVNTASGAVGSSPPAQTSSWCHTVAEIAVDTALIMAGIPPTLPTFEQAMQAAKGDLADLIVQQATALGVPCDEAQLAADASGKDTLTCKALAEALIDQIVETTKAAVAASATAVSGIFFPPGVYAVPHELGQTQPGSVTITVNPTPQASITGQTCQAMVLMSASYDAPDTFFGLSKLPDLNIGYDKNYAASNGMWVPAGKYSGNVIYATTISLPTLGKNAAGALQAATKTYVLGQLVAHDPVQGHAYWGNYASVHPMIPFESLQLHQFATLTTSVHAACASDVATVGIMVGNGQLAVTQVTG